MTQEQIDAGYDGFTSCNPESSRKDAFIAGTRFAELKVERAIRLISLAYEEGFSAYTMHTIIINTLEVLK